MKTNIKARFWFIGGVIALVFLVLTVQLANLQIRNSDVYGEKAKSKRTKVITLKGDRGQIMDASGTLLAYDKKIYNIEFYREPSSGELQNAAYSRAIWEVIQLVEKSGGTVLSNLWLKQDEKGQWVFDFGDITKEAAAKREKMWRANFYLNGVEQQQLFDKLCKNYGINALDKEHTPLTTEDKRKILGVWQEMQMNAFLSKPVRIAANVEWATVIEIETRLISLDGISISVTSQRIYPYGTLACHALGYIGKMQSGNSVETYLSKGYAMDDMVGLDGIEKSMEDWLTPNSSVRQGQRVVEVNRSGSIVREMSYTGPQNGNNIKLTIRSDLQRVAEKALADVIREIRNIEERTMQDSGWLEKNKKELLDRDLEADPIKLADRGAIVVLDMQARVLALVSSPNYDPNLFILGMDPDQQQRMLLDKRNPLFNNAIGARDTPGSVFKMATALAALTDGALKPMDTINDEGLFTKYDVVNPPKCWASNAVRLAKHQNQTVVEGLQNSCNYFFYTIASRLGEDGEKLYKFAAKLGLTSKTGIDLPGEVRSVVGSQNSLYDATRAITEGAQDTARPYLVKRLLKKHLRKIGEERNITYSDERLDRAIKSLMDMALTTPQTQWVRAIRPILMEELGMSIDMVYMQAVVGDIFLALNEIKWGGTETIQTAIGQSITLTTPIAMARYVTAIANGGMVYDVSIIDSIISPSGEVLNPLNKPAVANDLTEEIAPYLPFIKAGMKGVVDESGTAGKYFKGWKYENEIAGKTGTAEKSTIDLESNAWFVSFAPYENPEIVVVVYVPHGMSAGFVTPAAKAVIQYYLDSKVEVEKIEIPGPNALAP